MQSKAQAERRESDREAAKARCAAFAKEMAAARGKEIMVTWREWKVLAPGKSVVVWPSLIGKLSSVSVHQLRLVTDAGAVTVQMPAVTAWELIEEG